jgi:hypothetical protein
MCGAAVPPRNCRCFSCCSHNYITALNEYDATKDKLMAAIRLADVWFLVKLMTAGKWIKKMRDRLKR